MSAVREAPFANEMMGNMHATELDTRDLIDFAVAKGEIHIAGRRAIIVDTSALGMLKKELLDRLGADETRVAVTRFGYVQGWNLAGALQSQLRFESEAERVRACGRVLMLEGILQVQDDSPDPLSSKGAILTASFEAEQHNAHFGKSDRPTCSMICGLMSGYLSRLLDKEIFVHERSCIGKGDSTCCLIARTGQQWGDALTDDLKFMQREQRAGWLDASLHHVTQTLGRVEEKLRVTPPVSARSEIDHGVPYGLVAYSESMQRLVDLARRVAKVGSTVLITGESGSGKERIARLVHDESARAAGPFVAINCGAVTETLLESELFGHARGAFTGAVQHRPGLFEAAEGGTLMLDEIGEVSPGMQVKLLRALQAREIRRVGENRNRATNARVIAATNSNLTVEIAAGRFRKDLYYRLNVVELQVPPLRERREDILPLARILLAETAVRMNRDISGLSPRAADQLLRYEWPGNVRELENAMERAVALAVGDRIELGDLPEEVREAIPTPTLLTGDVKTLANIEKDHILAVLKLNDGNQARSAQMLDIGTATLYRKLKLYGALRGQA